MRITLDTTGLEAELEEELGYSRYDYRNKETDNSRVVSRVMRKFNLQTPAK